MRPGQNKRMRGRNNNNNNRKGPNPLTRSFESNGPDVKIRGTAHHVGEKYLQLARDAHSSGDPVRAESYLQHAEHYFRVIAAAQQAQYGFGRQAGEADLDDDDGDDDSMPDRFASPSERPVQQAVPERQPYQDRQGHQGQGHQGQGHQNPSQHNQGQQNQGQQGQPYQNHGAERGNGQSHGERHYDNRNGRNYDNRGGQDRSYQDRNPQDRNPQDRQQERGYQGHGQPGAGQPGNGQSGNGYDRNAVHRPEGERAGQDRGGAYERGQPNERQGQQDRTPREPFRDQARDYDNRPRGPRPPRPMAEARPPLPEEPVNGLPAFITAPTRVVAEPAEIEAVEQPVPSAEAGDEAVHLRPRRRRRPKPEFAEKADFDGEPRGEASTASDTAND